MASNENEYCELIRPSIDLECSKNLFLGKRLFKNDSENNSLYPYNMPGCQITKPAKFARNNCRDN